MGARNGAVRAIGRWMGTRDGALRVIGKKKTVARKVTAKLKTFVSKLRSMRLRSFLHQLSAVYRSIIYNADITYLLSALLLSVICDSDFICVINNVDIDCYRHCCYLQQ